MIVARGFRPRSFRVGYALITTDWTPAPRSLRLVCELRRSATPVGRSIRPYGLTSRTVWSVSAAKPSAVRRRAACRLLQGVVRPLFAFVVVLSQQGPQVAGGDVVRDAQPAGDLPGDLGLELPMRRGRLFALDPVSYTHLTLPTSDLV